MPVCPKTGSLLLYITTISSLFSASPGQSPLSKKSLDFDLAISSATSPASSQGSDDSLVGRFEPHPSNTNSVTFGLSKDSDQTW